MWPIGLAIGLFVVAYTIVNLNYRKDGQAYEPFQAMQDRREEIVEKNFYDWYRLKTKRSPTISPLAGHTAVKRSPVSENLEKVLPDQLVYYIPTRPILYPSPLSIDADPKLILGQPFKIRLELPSAIGSDERFQLQAFYKKGHIYMLASFFLDNIAEVSQDAFESPIEYFEFHIPTEPIDTTTAKCLLYTEGSLHEWKVEVEANGKAPAQS